MLAKFLKKIVFLSNLKFKAQLYKTYLPTLLSSMQTHFQNFYLKFMLYRSNLEFVKSYFDSNYRFRLKSCILPRPTPCEVTVK